MRGGLQVFSQDRIQQRAVEQTIDTPATSLVEMIVEVPVVRTPEKTQQVSNTLVQHVVNTIEVERPKTIKQTGQKPIIQEKINQVTKYVEVPQVQFPDKVDEMPVSVQRQNTMVQTVQKTMEIPQLQCIDEAIMTLLCRFHGSRSWRRLLGSHSCRLLSPMAPIMGQVARESLRSAAH